MRRLKILTLVSVMLAIAVFYIKNRVPSTIPAGEGLMVSKAWLTNNGQPLIDKKDVRPPDQTFLTYPEWFLVFSPAEQADYFEKHTSTTFPYLKHTDQLWKGYDIVYDQIKGNYPFNTGYHVMIMVIAGSTTLEYGVKASYETIFGRVTDTEDTAELTEEDRLNADYMRSYVNFIEDTPWYEYNFNKPLKTLWTNTSWFGPHWLRKMERKYYLTTELLVKSGYGWLIKKATKASYDAALLNTSVVVNKLPANNGQFKEIKNIKQLPGKLVMMDLPRYADFNTAVCKLAKSGVNFEEIAGNKSAILLTVLTRDTLKKDAVYQQLFTQPIFTKPGLKRIALVTPVSSLSQTVLRVTSSKATIEHIYDY